jgi:ABC-type lipoprotein export system ATPase subunit
MTPRKTHDASDRDASEQQLGKLAEYNVEGLFDRRDIRFDLAEAGPTILTGANGSGKSTVLRTIDAISTASWSRLDDISFSRLTLTFSSDVRLVITRHENRMEITRTDQEIPWSWQPPQSWVLQPKSNLSYIDPISSTWANLRMRHTTEQFLVYSPGSSISQGFWIDSNPTPASGHWVNRLPSDFPVLFVTDDRLVVTAQTTENAEGLSSQAVPTSAAVDQAIENIGQVQAQALAEYARTAQSIDREFPSRVISAMEREIEPSDRELDALLSTVATRRKELLGVGLLPGDEPPIEELRFTATHAKTVIRIFAEDTMRKFAALESVRARLQVLTEFLNRHYRGKQILVDSKAGAVVVDTESSEPQVLRPSRLSSGEQQILVLAHQVLFRADPGTLVLIDEPELSLHVLWQSDFVDDLTRMGETSKLSFLLATHSPTLIAGREDLRRSLDPT